MGPRGRTVAAAHLSLPRLPVRSPMLPTRHSRQGTPFNLIKVAAVLAKNLNLEPVALLLVIEVSTAL